MVTISENDVPPRLAQTVYEKIEQMIFSGELQSGTVLSERRLAEALGLSRTPLRDALLMLASDGLIERRGQRYLQVREISIPEFIHILNTRRLLEPEAARLAAAHIDQAGLSNLRERIEEARRREHADLPPAEGSGSLEIDNDLHNLIAVAAGNPLMANIIYDLKRRTRIFSLNRMPERFEEICLEHLAIVDALQSSDGAAAAHAMTVHIDNAKASIVRRLSEL